MMLRGAECARMLVCIYQGGGMDIIEFQNIFMKKNGKKK